MHTQINNIFAQSRIDNLDKLIEAMHNSPQKASVEYYKAFLDGVLCTYIAELSIDAQTFKEYSDKVLDVYNQKKEKGDV